MLHKLTLYFPKLTQYNVISEKDATMTNFPNQIQFQYDALLMEIPLLFTLAKNGWAATVQRSVHPTQHTARGFRKFYMPVNQIIDQK